MLPDFDVHGAGDGTPLVLIHGFPFHRGQWAPQTAAPPAGRPTVAYDLRGQGRTPRGDGAAMIEFLVDDLVELLDHLAIERACLCGLSMGGYVALRAVDRHPERVHGLVLCDTRAGADSNEGRVARAAAIRTVRAHGMVGLAEGLLPKLFPRAQLEAETPAVTAVREMMHAADPQGACDALTAMACRLDLSERLPAIDTPTLVLVGSEDTLTPPADARAMAAAIPGARCAVLEGAGHVANLGHPEAFDARLHPFLADLDRRPAS